MRLFGVRPGARGWVYGFEGVSCDWGQPAGGADEVQGCCVVGGDVSHRFGWWLDLRLVRLAVSRSVRGLADNNVVGCVAIAVLLLKSRNRFRDPRCGPIAVSDFPESPDNGLVVDDVPERLVGADGEGEANQLAEGNLGMIDTAHLRQVAENNVFAG